MNIGPLDSSHVIAFETVVIVETCVPVTHGITSLET